MLPSTTGQVLLSTTFEWRRQSFPECLSTEMRQETQHDEQSRAAVRPGTLLVVLTLMFCFIYMDRGMPRSQAVVILNGMSQAPLHRTASMESGERRKTQTALDSKSSLLMHLHLSTWLGWM